MSTKYPCPGCKKMFNSKSLVRFKGLFICGTCRRSTPGSKAQEAVQSMRLVVSLEKALEKTYEVKTYSKTNLIHVPSIMQGRKVKLVLVEEENE